MLVSASVQGRVSGSGRGFVGTIAGLNKGVISECMGYENTVSGYDNAARAGGICGKSVEDSIIKSCVVIGGSVCTSVQAQQTSGGICGVIGNYTVVDRCLSQKCNVSKTTLWGGTLGGVVGFLGQSAKVTNCAYEGSLTKSAGQSYWRIYGVPSTYRCEF